MHCFDFNTVRSLKVARGGAKQLAERVAELGCRSALIITDPGLLRSGMLDAALAGFSRLGVRQGVYSDVQADPPEAVIHAATRAVLDQDADFHRHHRQG